jgi:sugar phosphate isomerase/epimerase
VSGPLVGVQMYTVDDLSEKDYRGTLGRIAQLGYRGVETYGLHGHPPQAISKMARDTGLVISSAHAPFPAGKEARRVLDEVAELGAPMLSWSLEADEFSTVATIEHGSQRINEAAANAAAYHIELGYHNHWAEFTNSIDGRSAYEVLWEFLDDRVVAEVDVYWAKLGGHDPAALLAWLGPRACYLHLRDGPADDPASLMVAVGRGSLDTPSIIASAPAARWHLVEMGPTEDEIFQVLQDSYTYLVDGGFSTGQMNSM